MFQVKPRLIAGVSLCALAAATPFMAAGLTERAIRAEIAALPDTEAASVHVSLVSGTVTVDGLRSGNATIGRIRYSAGPLGLIAPAYAQAGAVTFDKMVWTHGMLAVEMPSLAMVGSTVGKDDFGKLFAFDASLADRLKGFSAQSISAPSIKLSFKMPDVSVMNYEMRNVTADQIVAGRIGKLVVGASSYDAKDANVSQLGTGGRSEVTGLDLAQGARVYFATAQPGEKPMPLYDGYSFDGMTQTITGMVPVDLEYGRFQSGAFRARPLNGKSIATLVQEAMAQAERAKNDGKLKDKDEGLAALRSFIGPFNDAVQAFEDDGTTMENIRFSTGDRAKPVAAGVIKSIRATYGNATSPASFSIHDTDVKAPGVTARLALLSVEGFSYAPIFKALDEAVKADDFDFKTIDPRRFIPKLGTVTIKGFEVDAPDPKAPKGVTPERINARLGTFLFSARDQIGGIPTDIQLGLENLAVKLPENSSEEGIKTLKALGYSALDVSARIAAKWSEAKREVALSELSVSGKDMGAARLSGVIGNIGRDVFEADTTMATVALMGATAKALSLKVDNAGLAEKLLAMQARTQSRKPDDLRKELGTVAAMGIPAILGPSDEAKAIANAVARFLTKPKSLTIDVTAKNAGGLGIPDIATIGDPQKALGLVNVKAAATD